jgi:hypothetical protein
MNLSSLASEKAAEAAFPDTHTVVGPETVGSFPRMVPISRVPFFIV